MKEKIKLILSPIKYLGILISTIFIFTYIFNLLFFISLDYKTDFYKFNNLNFLNRAYLNINIKAKNCELIKEYLNYKIDLAPINHHEVDYIELLNLTSKCDLYKNDYIFLNKLKNNEKLDFPEEIIIKLSANYWYFIKDYKKELYKLVIDDKNKKLLNTFENQFK